MKDGRRLALLILIDALLSVAVVHRAHQHDDAKELRRLAVDTIKAARTRNQVQR